MLIFVIKRRFDLTSLVPDRNCSRMATKVLIVLRCLSLELESESDGEIVSPPKQFAGSDGIQAETIIIRVKLSDALGEVRGEKAAFLHISVKPEQSGIELVAV